jgi:hypothetical protein
VAEAATAERIRKIRDSPTRMVIDCDGNAVTGESPRSLTA